MALSLEMTVAIVAVGVAVLAIVLYLEVRYMKSRRKDKVDVALMRDDAYNALMTTQAVSRALKDQGRNTKEADIVLVKAEAAYERHDYLVSKELAEEARSILKQSRAPEKKESVEEAVSTPVVEHATEGLPPFQEIRKLPQNYLESRFMIETARMCIEEAKTQGIDISDAEKTLAVASECYARTEYTEALKNALRAKKAAEGQKVAPRIEAKPSEVREKPEAAPAGTTMGIACASCGQIVDEDDKFCRRCGAAVVRVPKCSVCGLEVDRNDAFCRRCGAKLN